MSCIFSCILLYEPYKPDVTYNAHANFCVSFYILSKCSINYSIGGGYFLTIIYYFMPGLHVCSFYFRCMTDSKSSRWSKFIQSGQRNVVRFSLDAFLFHGMLGEVK